jgi:hypothetical protein
MSQSLLIPGRQYGIEVVEVGVTGYYEYSGAQQ